MTDTKEKAPASTAVATRAPATLYERLLALSKTPAERERAFALAEKYQQQQLVQELVAEVKAKSWGNNVSPALRVEIVRWTLENGGDPVTEVDILGGSPYLNARYWMRLVAAEPDFVKAEEVWVHPDPRATDEENAKRKDLRIQYAIPDEIAATVGVFGDDKRAAAAKRPPVPIKAAVLVFLYFRGRGPFIGKKWSPSRANDDVGMDHPEASALTRAWRKAALGGVRRTPPFSNKLTNLIVAQRVADQAGGQEPVLGVPAAKPLDGIGGEAVPAMTSIGAGDSRDPYSDEIIMTKHNPNAFCNREGDHPIDECPLGKTKP